MDDIARLNKSHSDNDATHSRVAIGRGVALEMRHGSFPQHMFHYPSLFLIYLVKGYGSQIYDVITDPTNLVGTCYTLQGMVRFSRLNYIRRVFQDNRPVAL
jgi:hypothetical protein